MDKFTHEGTWADASLCSDVGIQLAGPFPILQAGPTPHGIQCLPGLCSSHGPGHTAPGVAEALQPQAYKIGSADFVSTTALDFKDDGKVGLGVRGVLPINTISIALGVSNFHVIVFRNKLTNQSI